MIAENRQQFRARTLGSRALSGVIAVGMGTVLTIAQELFTAEGINLKTAITSFITPAIAQTMAQVRSERTQRRDLQDLREVAAEVTASHEARVSELRAVITEAGLPLPDQ